MASVLFQIINCSSVIIDPIIYIMYHEKYRKAIDKVLGAVQRKRDAKDNGRKRMDLSFASRDSISGRHNSIIVDHSQSMKVNCGTIGSTYHKLIKNLHSPPTQ